MAGILIYTAAPDSEGTLGGLVQMGAPERLGQVLRQAVAALQLCTSDPLCAHHVPDQTGLDLHGASCHACLFASETSCERGNRYLDRSLLVATMESDLRAYFGAAPVVEPEPPVAVPTVPGIEVEQGQGMPFQRLEKGQLTGPVHHRTWEGMPAGSRLFALQMPDQRLNREIPEGAWVVMERLGPKDDLPEDDTICLVEGPTGLELGRLFTSARVDENNQALPTAILLRFRSSEPGYPARRWEVPAAQWPAWRPVARFHGLTPEVTDAG